MKAISLKTRTATWPRQNTGGWSSQKALCFVLALVPMLVLAAIIFLLVINSETAVSTLGLRKLFGTEFSSFLTSGKGIYGLLPGIWGTFLVVLTAMILALPVAITLAIMASDFSLGFLGAVIRGALGLFSGIPPVIYALMSSVVGSLFIIPKFTGAGIPPNELPPPGLTWWTPYMLPYDRSTLLGGILLALLIVPFMTPLIYDAMKNVPSSLKEASLALGANRWHTMLKVTLPGALAGINAAITLGILKSMGDVVILGWAIGYESGLPVPMIDIFERTAPLTSTAAGLAGGFTMAGQHGALQMSVANFTGLLLLTAAFGILGASALLQRVIMKRLNA